MTWTEKIIFKWSRKIGLKIRENVDMWCDALCLDQWCWTAWLVCAAMRDHMCRLRACNERRNWRCKQEFACWTVQSALLRGHRQWCGCFLQPLCHHIPLVYSHTGQPVEHLYCLSCTIPHLPHTEPKEFNKRLKTLLKQGELKQLSNSFSTTNGKQKLHTIA